MKRGRNQRRRQGVNINRAFDSNGPDVRIRGTANQIYDKYLALARDATSSGDRVKAENYLQHAEHYFRVIRSMQAAQQPPQVEASDGEGEQPSLGAGKERERRPREAASGDGPQAPRREQAESGGGGAKAEGDGADAAAAKSGNGLDESAVEAGEAPRRPRRRRPRRSTKPEGEEAASEIQESTEAAAS